MSIIVFIISIIFLVFFIILMFDFINSLINALAIYIQAVIENIHFINYEWVNKDGEPVKRNYFFGPCYQQLKDIIEEGHLLMNEDRKERLRKIDEKSDCDSFFGSVRYIAGFAIVPEMIFLDLALTLLMICILGGSCFIIQSLIFILYMIMRIIDQFYYIFKDINNDCPQCKKQFLIPAYICPHCHRLHKKLVPGIYGILHHKCECGELLPSTFFTGRNHLDAYCPYCEERLHVTGTKSVLVQLVGAPNTGKTVFLASYFHEYFEKIKQNKNITHTMNQHEKSQFQELEQYFQGLLPDATTDFNSKLYSCIVSGNGIEPQRKFGMYDIGGEIFGFTNNSHEIVQEQLKYCNGIILLIDPLSSYLFRQECINDGIDIKNYCQMEGEEATTNFINYLISINALQLNKKSHKPLSIVLTKADIKIIKQKIGPAKIKALYRNKSHAETYDQLRDEMIIEFLNEYGMGNIVSLIENYFTNVHYFCVSAIGHEPNREVFHPFGIQECVEWMIKETDYQYYKAINNKEV